MLVEVLLLFILLTMSSSLGLSVYSFVNRTAPAGRAFSFMMINTFFWSLFAVFILVVPDLETKVLLTRFRMIFAINAAPVLVLIHTQIYSDSDLYKYPWLQRAFFIPSIFSISSLFIPALQEYGLTNFQLIDSLGLSTVSYQRGFWITLQVYFNYACAFYAYSIAARMFLRGNSNQKNQAVLLSVGTLVPLVGHWIGTQTDWALHFYHLTPALTCVTAILFSIALFRYQLLDWAHLAKSQVFERLPDPVLKLDGDHRLRVFNTAASRVFSLRHDHIGRLWHEALERHPRLIQTVTDELKLMKESKTTPKRVLEFLNEGHSDLQSWVIHIECSNSWSPSDYGLLISFHDISERKALESQIRNHTDTLTSTNSRLEQLVGFKNRLLSLVAHDLSGNIGTMVMVSSALQGKVENHVDEPAQKMLRLMVRSSVTVQEFFSNLILWIAKLDSKLEPHLRICDMKVLIEKSVDQLTPMLLAQRQKVVVQSKDPVFVAADPDMITTVIRNLLSNAIAASVPGQEITIGIDETPEEVKLWVQDLGIGITPAKLQLLLTSSTSSELPKAADSAFAGFGIGLSLCRDFIDYHGGKLSGDSEVGKGSRFYFTLPKSPAREFRSNRP